MMESICTSSWMRSPHRKSEMVPRQWPDETVVIIASGPSLLETDVELCRGKMRCIAVNDNWRLAPWADVLYACDVRWWVHHKGVPEFTGEKWTCDPRARAQFKELNCVPGKFLPGLSFNPAMIHTGRNSGYQAINLAVLFGAKRILLLGFDMQKTGGKAHWFGPHDSALVATSGYDGFIQCFRTIPPLIKGRGIEIINCTRETALSMFPRMAIEEVFATA